MNENQYAAHALDTFSLTTVSCFIVVWLDQWTHLHPFEKRLSICRAWVCLALTFFDVIEIQHALHISNNVKLLFRSSSCWWRVLMGLQYLHRGPVPHVTLDAGCSPTVPSHKWIGQLGQCLNCSLVCFNPLFLSLQFIYLTYAHRRRLSSSPALISQAITMLFKHWEYLLPMGSKLDCSRVLHVSVCQWWNIYKEPSE